MSYKIILESSRIGKIIITQCSALGSFIFVRREGFGHKLLSFLFLVRQAHHHKKQSTRDPGSAISSADEIMPPPFESSQKQINLLFPAYKKKKTKVFFFVRREGFGHSRGSRFVPSELTATSLPRPPLAPCRFADFVGARFESLRLLQNKITQCSALG